MKRMILSEDEAFPVYSLTEDWGVDPSSPALVDVDDEFVAEYERVMDKYGEMQVRLERLWESRRARVLAANATVRFDSLLITGDD